MASVISNESSDVPTRVGQIFIEVVNQAQIKAIKVADASLQGLALMEKAEDLIEEAQNNFENRVLQLGDVIHKDYMPRYIEILAENFGFYKLYDQISDQLTKKTDKVDCDLFDNLRI